jgi:hypothetical protein
MRSMPKIIAIMVAAMLACIHQEPANAQITSFAYANLETVTVTVQVIPAPLEASDMLLDRQLVLDLASRSMADCLSSVPHLKVLEHDSSDTIRQPANLTVAVQVVARATRLVPGTEALVDTENFPGVLSIHTRTFRTVWPQGIQPGFFEVSGEAVVMSPDKEVLLDRLQAALRRQLEPLCTSIVFRNAARKP